MNLGTNNEGVAFDDDRIFRLAAKACEESITESEMRELDLVLRASPEARRVYREYTNVHVTLGTCFGAAAQLVSPGKIEVFPVTFKSATTVTAAPHRARRLGLAAMAAAAVLGVGLGVSLWFSGEDGARDALVSAGEESGAVAASVAPPVAAVAAVAPVEAGWPAPEVRERTAPAIASPKSPAKRASAPPDVGLAVVRDLVSAKWPAKGRRFGEDKWITAPSTFAIDAGLARLKFRDGAMVTVRGPASLRIVSGNAAVLERGEIYSTVPPSAVGFVVETSTVEIVDYGTAFGVSAEPDGTVEVHVYEGEVRLHAPEGAPEAFEGEKRLLKGDAIRARASTAPNPAGGKAASRKTAFDEVGFGAQAFQRLRSLHAGVENASRTVRVVEEPPAEQLGKVENNQALFVFPERDRVVIDEPLAVAFTEPGTYRNSESETTLVPTVGGGVTVRSYLLHFNPVGQPKKGKVYKGSITFDAPIVGVIASARQLAATDALFARNLAFYKPATGRTMDWDPEGPITAHQDNVTLAPNRRTLQIEWNASAAMDEIRVLVLDEGF